MQGEVEAWSIPVHSNSIFFPLRPLWKIPLGESSSREPAPPPLRLPLPLVLEQTFQLSSEPLLSFLLFFLSFFARVFEVTRTAVYRVWRLIRGKENWGKTRICSASTKDKHRQTHRVKLEKTWLENLDQSGPKFLPPGILPEKNNFNFPSFRRNIV